MACRGQFEPICPRWYNIFLSGHKPTSTTCWCYNRKCCSGEQIVGESYDTHRSCVRMSWVSLNTLKNCGSSMRPAYVELTTHARQSYESFQRTRLRLPYIYRTRFQFSSHFPRLLPREFYVKAFTHNFNFSARCRPKRKGAPALLYMFWFH